ncbi:MAG TPA: efflux RND transporter permease subunit, partial [Nitrosomonas sp.]|nr:efflux RND transporter permease subunit [Nitrosomonas sp.]
PFLTATGLGSEIQKPLAVVVIFGLTTATCMTMIVMPMIYRWFDTPPKRDLADSFEGVTAPAVEAVAQTKKA